MAKKTLTDEAEKPKRTSLILCTTLQTIGWILLINTAGFFIMTLTGQLGAIGDRQLAEIVIIFISYWFALEFLVLGVSVIIFGQLARFIIQQISRPGLMLRWGSTILIVFACVTVLWAVSIYLSFKLSFKPLLPAEMVNALSVVFIAGVAIKAAVLILMSQILKRVMPIIEESKALV